DHRRDGTWSPRPFLLLDDCRLVGAGVCRGRLGNLSARDSPAIVVALATYTHSQLWPFHGGGPLHAARAQPSLDARHFGDGHARFGAAEGESRFGEIMAACAQPWNSRGTGIHIRFGGRTALTCLHASAARLSSPRLAGGYGVSARSTAMGGVTPRHQLPALWGNLAAKRQSRVLEISGLRFRPDQ